MEGTQTDTRADGPELAAAGKRTRLEGGALSEEAIDSSRGVLDRTLRGSQRGLQQYFAPPEAATLARRVIAGETWRGMEFAPAVLRRRATARC